MSYNVKITLIADQYITDVVMTKFFSGLECKREVMGNSLHL